MNKSDIKWLVALLVFIAVGMWGLIWSYGASADYYPEGIDIFQIPSGQWCVLAFGQLEGCYCECPETGRLCETALQVPPTDRPSVPRTTPGIPTEEPNNERCNRGLGNGPEDCDPGNSGGNPGKAGEGDG